MLSWPMSAPAPEGLSFVTAAAGVQGQEQEAGRELEQEPSQVRILGLVLKLDVVPGGVVGRAERLLGRSVSHEQCVVAAAVVLKPALEQSTPA